LIAPVVIAVTALTPLVVSSTPTVISSATAATKILFVLPTATAPLKIIPLKILVAVLDEGSIAEFQLSAGDVIQFCPDRIIVYQFLVPVAVGQFHVICDGMGKSGFLIGVFLLQGFLYHYFQVTTQVSIFGMSLRIRQGIGFLVVGFPGRPGIRTIYIKGEITDKK
jgi:hypothetical protein